jgi:hypothetical protein
MRFLTLVFTVLIVSTLSQASAQTAVSSVSQPALLDDRLLGLFVVSSGLGLNRAELLEVVQYVISQQRSQVYVAGHVWQDVERDNPALGRGAFLDLFLPVPDPWTALRAEGLRPRPAVPFPPSAFDGRQLEFVSRELVPHTERLLDLLAARARQHLPETLAISAALPEMTYNFDRGQFELLGVLNWSHFPEPTPTPRLPSNLYIIPKVELPETSEGTRDPELSARAATLFAIPLRPQFLRIGTGGGDGTVSPIDALNRMERFSQRSAAYVLALDRELALISEAAAKSVVDDLLLVEGSRAEAIVQAQPLQARINLTVESTSNVRLAASVMSDLPTSTPPTFAARRASFVLFAKLASVEILGSRGNLITTWSADQFASAATVAARVRQQGQDAAEARARAADDLRQAEMARLSAQQEASTRAEKSRGLLAECGSQRSDMRVSERIACLERVCPEVDALVGQYPASNEEAAGYPAYMCKSMLAELTSMRDQTLRSIRSACERLGNSMVALGQTTDRQAAIDNCIADQLKNSQAL